MNEASKERELIERTKRFIKAEPKRADVTYEGLAERSANMGLKKPRARLPLR
jgi:hypothetical protein